MPLSLNNLQPHTHNSIICEEKVSTKNNAKMKAGSTIGFNTQTAKKHKKGRLATAARQENKILKVL